MNIQPSRKQARLRNGWFLRDGQKISQPMFFPCDHPDFPNEPKGIKTVLTEHGLFQSGLRGKCQKCDSDKDDCCNKCFRQISRIRNLLFKMSLRLWDICAFFCPNSIASSILLRFFGM